MQDIAAMQQSNGIAIAMNNSNTSGTEKKTSNGDKQTMMTTSTSDDTATNVNQLNKSATNTTTSPLEKEKEKETKTKTESDTINTTRTNDLKSSSFHMRINMIGATMSSTSSSRQNAISIPVVVGDCITSDEEGHHYGDDDDHFQEGDFNFDDDDDDHTPTSVSYEFDGSFSESCGAEFDEIQNSGNNDISVTESYDDENDDNAHQQQQQQQLQQHIHTLNPKSQQNFTQNSNRSIDGTNKRQRIMTSPNPNNTQTTMTSTNNSNKVSVHDKMDDASMSSHASAISFVSDDDHHHNDSNSESVELKDDDTTPSKFQFMGNSSRTLDSQPLMPKRSSSVCGDGSVDDDDDDAHLNSVSTDDWKSTNSNTKQNQHPMDTGNNDKNHDGNKTNMGKNNNNNNDDDENNNTVDYASMEVSFDGSNHDEDDSDNDNDSVVNSVVSDITEASGFNVLYKQSLSSLMDFRVDDTGTSMVPLDDHDDDNNDDDNEKKNSISNFRQKKKKDDDKERGHNSNGSIQFRRLSTSSRRSDEPPKPYQRPSLNDSGSSGFLSSTSLSSSTSRPQDRKHKDKPPVPLRRASSDDSNHMLLPPPPPIIDTIGEHSIPDHTIVGDYNIVLGRLGAKSKNHQSGNKKTSPSSSSSLSSPRSNRYTAASISDTISSCSSTSSTRTPQKALLKLAEQFVDNCPVGMHTYRLKRYPKTFVGSEAVDCMIKAKLASTREDAVFLGQRFCREMNLFHHVHWDHTFKDGNYFYRFTVDTKNKLRVLPTLSHNDLRSIGSAFAQSMKVSKNLSRMVKYKATFFGNKAVDHMIAIGLALDRAHAVHLGQRMLVELKLIHHVTHEHQFKDLPLLYRFSRDETASYSSSSEDTASIASLMTALQSQYSNSRQSLTLSDKSIVTAASLTKSPDPSRCSTASTRRRKIRVTFGDIYERHFERCLTTNPATGSGPSLGLGWRFYDYPPFPISHAKGSDDFLDSDDRHHRRSFRLSSSTRTQLLIYWGHTKVEIAKAIKMNEKIRKQRKKTLNNMTVRTSYES